MYSFTDSAVFNIDDMELYSGDEVIKYCGCNVTSDFKPINF